MRRGRTQAHAYLAAAAFGAATGDAALEAFGRLALATELRGAMMSQLHRDARLPELQALLAAASAETRGRATSDGVSTSAPPQVMCAMPLIHPWW